MPTSYCLVKEQIMCRTGLGQFPVSQRHHLPFLIRSSLAYAPQSPAVFRSHAKLWATRPHYRYLASRPETCVPPIRRHCPTNHRHSPPRPSANLYIPIYPVRQQISPYFLFHSVSGILYPVLSLALCLPHKIRHNGCHPRFLF